MLLIQLLDLLLLLTVLMKMLKCSRVSGGHFQIVLFLWLLVLVFSIFYSISLVFFLFLISLTLYTLFLFIFILFPRSIVLDIHFCFSLSFIRRLSCFLPFFIVSLASSFSFLLIILLLDFNRFIFSIPCSVRRSLTLFRNFESPHFEKQSSSNSCFSTKFRSSSSILTINQLANYSISLRALSRNIIKSNRALNSSSHSTIINRLNHLTKQMSTATSSTFDRKLFLADQSPPVCSLEIKAPFAELTEKESKYYRFSFHSHPIISNKNSILYLLFSC